MRRFQDAGKRRRIKTDSGKMRTIPALPYEYWCKPNGNLVRLVVMTTRNTEQAVDPQRYADFARRSAIKDGWFPWEWQNARVYAPQCLGTCKTAEDWDKYRHEVQAQRRNEHIEQTKRNAAVWLEQAGQRKMETQEALADALKAFGEKILPASKPRGSNG